MISRISQVVLLAGCLAGAGGASAVEREALVVPVMAGVAVGALVASAFDDRRDDRYRRDYRQAPRVLYYPPRPIRHQRYRPAPRHVHYVAVPVREGGRHDHRRH